jgi:hypothetical protein
MGFAKSFGLQRECSRPRSILQRRTVSRIHMQMSPVCHMEEHAEACRSMHSFASLALAQQYSLQFGSLARGAVGAKSMAFCGEILTALLLFASPSALLCQCGRSPRWRSLWINSITGAERRKQYIAFNMCRATGALLSLFFHCKSRRAMQLPHLNLAVRHSKVLRVTLSCSHQNMRSRWCAG